MVRANFARLSIAPGSKRQCGSTMAKSGRRGPVRAGVGEVLLFEGCQQGLVDGDGLAPENGRLGVLRGSL